MDAGGRAEGGGVLMRGGEIEGWRERGEGLRGQPSEISKGREWKMKSESESRWRYFTSRQIDG